MEVYNNIYTLALITCKAVYNMGGYRDVTNWATYTLKHIRSILDSKGLSGSPKIKGGGSSFILL